MTKCGFISTKYPNPWGHSNTDLFTMYRGATADNECPMVIDSF
jgi:DNA sulfur modification protein DndC